MAGSARRITVEFLGDAKKLDATANQVERRTTSLGGHMSRIGKVAGVALAGGIAAAGAAMVGMVKNAAEDAAAARKLKVALENTTGATDKQVASVENWISAQGRALGVTDDELRPALQRLVQATGDISKAQDLAKIAMDASAGSGKSLKVVTEAIAKAQNGNLGSLSRLGVKIKDTNGKTLSFNEAMKGMADTFKGQAAAGANTLDGKMTRLKVMFDETKESIGYKLIPVMTQFMNLILKGSDWIGKHSTLVKVLATVIGGLAGTLWLVAKAQAAVNLVMSLNPIGLVIAAVAALVVGLVIAYKKSDTFRSIVKGAFDAIGKACFFMWDKVIRPVLKLWINMWLTVVGALVNGAAKAFGWVPGIGPKLKKAADWFNDFKKKVNDTLDGVHDKKVKISAPGADHTISQLKTLNNLLNVIDSKKQANVNVTTPGMFNPGTTKKGHAKGTTNAPAGWAWAGENGPELVNWRRGAQVVPAARSAAAASGSTVVINVNGALDPNGVARQIEQILTKYARTTGRPLSFA